MQGRKLLHTLFRKTFSFIHKKRLSALLDAVSGLLIGKRLSLTHLGRNLQSNAKERNCIRKVDRLLGNRHLHKEIRSIYHVQCLMLIKQSIQPVISVDWAATDKRKNWHILRATVNIRGRGYVLYQEVHPRKHSNSRKVQNKFLNTLKSLLPENCKPVIVADAGFMFPWFKKIKQIGFDFVGRVRHKTGYKELRRNQWYSNCLDLYAVATSTAKYLGIFCFVQKAAFECGVVLYKKDKKHREHINRSGYRTNNTASNRCSRRETDPWMLVTSLNVGQLGAKKIVEIYGKRMQIEEDFRDIKSHQFGFSLRYAMSNSSKRIEVLLVIAALACLVCWLLSLNAKKKNLHLDFQSNSIKNRDVLSVIYLGCQLIRRRYEITFDELKESYFSLQRLIMEASL